MKCPKCGKPFYRLDSESVDDTGQCKGPGGCGFAESCNYVRGWHAARREIIDGFSGLSCEGCRYWRKPETSGAKGMCLIGLGNNCIRQAEDYYDKVE